MEKKIYNTDEMYDKFMELMDFPATNKEVAIFLIEETNKDRIRDEIGFLKYLIEYPELCKEKCKERITELNSLTKPKAK